MDRKVKQILQSKFFADLPINRKIPQKLIHKNIDLAITNLQGNQSP